MKILITGASGFIGAQITTHLLQAGHDVICCVRNIAFTQRIFPGVKTTAADFIKDIAVETWLPRLHEIDVVINCVGIFYHPNDQITWAIHYHTPKALFTACTQTQVKQIIHISALGIENVDVAYANSKRAIDEFLTTLPLANIILRPSFVYGRGSYGGSSLFRGLASMPWLIPLPKGGLQMFQPIHLQDLSQAIACFITTQQTSSLSSIASRPQQQSQLYYAVGPQRVSLREIMQQLRAWLGFPPAPSIAIPMIATKLGALFGNRFAYSTLNSTAVKMMHHDNVVTQDQCQSFWSQLNFKPRGFAEGLFSQPSTVQDHWHARLYLLKPVLLTSLGLLWIFTGVCTLWLWPKTGSIALINQVGIPHALQSLVFYGCSALDIILGLALLLSFHIKTVLKLQLISVLSYTLLITLKLPLIWFDPLAPVAKNILIIVALLIALALESDR